MLDTNSERNMKIRQLATDFYKKERAAILKNAAAKKMKEVFQKNPEVFQQKNGWMDSFAMDRFGDEVYAATIVDAIEQKFKTDPTYVFNTEATFARLEQEGKDVKEIFLERLVQSEVAGARDAGLAIVAEREKDEAEKAESEARERRLRHMEKQAEILERMETLAKADNTESGRQVRVGELVTETNDKFLIREASLWQELYGLYNPKADATFVAKVADRLLSRFAKAYYKDGDDGKPLSAVPEDVRKDWIARFHENSLYLFGQLAKNGSEDEKQALSNKRYYAGLSAEMYRRYPEYEAETLSEMPVCIRFIRGAASELESGASGYRYTMESGKAFIVPTDIVKAADGFNGFIIRGTRGWVRKYELYASDGSEQVSLSEIEADSVLANEKFYKDIVALFSK